jgi:hypothetical protein
MNRQPGGVDDADLAAARADVRALGVERRRLSVERAGLLAGGFSVIGSAAGLSERGASLDALIDAIDSFTSGTFPRMEARCLAGEPGLCARLRATTAKILTAAGGTSALADTIDDVRALVEGARDDAAPALMNAAMAAGGIVGGLIGGGVASSLAVPLWVRLAGRVVGGGVGVGAAHLAAKRLGLG